MQCNRTSLLYCKAVTSKAVSVGLSELMTHSYECPARHLLHTINAVYFYALTAIDEHQSLSMTPSHDHAVPVDAPLDPMLSI